MRSERAILKRWLGREGITLIETVLMLSVAAATTVIVMPAASSMLGAAKETRVNLELNAIGAALAEYCRDVGYYPGMEPGAATGGGPRVLVGEGPFPGVREAVGSEGWRTARRLSLVQYLRSDKGSPRGRWWGPYLSHNVAEDPWGNAYVVNIEFCDTATPPSPQRRAVYVLSAGENGIIDTPFEQLASEATVRGDDWAVRVQ